MSRSRHRPTRGGRSDSSQSEHQMSTVRFAKAGIPLAVFCPVAGVDSRASEQPAVASASRRRRIEAAVVRDTP